MAYDAQYQKDYYSTPDGRRKRLDANKAYRLRLRRWIWEQKGSHPCKECGENDPRCIDFHHRDPDAKLLEVARMVTRGYSKERIEEEISKCDPLCSNCHRKLHYGPIAQW